MVWKHSKKKADRRAVFFILLFFAAVVVFVVFKGRIWEEKEFITRENLDRVVVTVDGEKLTLKDLVFYLAYEELAVDKQARIYSPSSPILYWNLHTKEAFIRQDAKQNVIDMAVHDAIFYAEAQKLGLTLNEEDKEYLSSAQTDFWYDLTKEQQEMIGVSREVLDESMYRIAVAEKYQDWISKDTGILYDSFRAAGTAYKEKVLPDHTYEVLPVWEEVPFGRTVFHYEVGRDNETGT